MTRTINFLAASAVALGLVLSTAGVASAAPAAPSASATADKVRGQIEGKVTGLAQAGQRASVAGKAHGLAVANERAAEQANPVTEDAPPAVSTSSVTSVPLTLEAAGTVDAENGDDLAVGGWFLYAPADAVITFSQPGIEIVSATPFNGGLSIMVRNTAPTAVTVTATATWTVPAV